MILFWSLKNIAKISASSSTESALMYTADLWETILILEILHSIADVFVKDSGKRRHMSQVAAQAGQRTAVEPVALRFGH